MTKRRKRKGKRGKRERKKTSIQLIKVIKEVRGVAKGQLAKGGGVGKKMVERKNWCSERPLQPP